MKPKVLMWAAAALLVAFSPRPANCRPADPPSIRRPFLLRPLLLHLGEEFSLRLGGDRAAPDLPISSSSSSVEVRRALLKLAQRLLLARVEAQKEEEEEVVVGEAGELGKRSDDPPISLDLTFHLLREVLEMARAEQLAQQADTNRQMMETFGK